MTEIKDRFIALIAVIAETRPETIAETSTFRELDLDSLALVELSMQAEEAFAVPIEEEAFQADTTVDEALRLINGRLGVG
ncbi:acyl carrier protein [Nonomuraea sp. NPDC050663]|uniref:Acyl carrier protein n=1 Tax=Nonomuraea soli TaxID=1032476 RepID=A0A7W0CGQ7_9ACTN|nr:acyl carrier protein [Nonomuraea soli]MBA2890838.1 acyl carrier protein [Nonomuraea soli]